MFKADTLTRAPLPVNSLEGIDSIDEDINPMSSKCIQKQFAYF